MTSTNEFKKILEKYEIKITEEQISELKNFMLLMADLAIEICEKNELTYVEPTKKYTDKS